jgi:hypothetical protein
MESNEEILKISGSIRISQASANHKPQLEIRTSTTEKQKIQDIITAAWNNKPIILYPEIKNKPAATNQLLKHNIIEREGDTYYFKN